MDVRLKNDALGNTQSAKLSRNAAQCEAYTKDVEQARFKTVRFHNGAMRAFENKFYLLRYKDKVNAMDRLEAQKLLPEFSADCLDAQSKAAVQRWVDECPDCQAEWHSLQTVILAASTASQPLLTPEQSRRMWENCSQKIYDNTEAARLKQQNPSMWSWMQSQPRWGWAMLGGAVVMLGAAWFSNPDANGPNASGASPIVASANVNGDDIGELQTFGRQPSYAATMVDHHSQMALDPFADHVGSSLVSYSAGAPQSGK